MNAPDRPLDRTEPVDTTPQAAGHGAVFARLASALGTTEGQAQTLTIGLVLALVLLLTGVPPVLRDRIQEIAVPSAAPASDPTATPVTEQAPPTTEGESAEAAPDPSMAPPAAEPPLDQPDRRAPAPPEPDPPPRPESPCAASAAIDPAGQALDRIRSQLPVVPSRSTVLLLATLTGCDDEDPAVLLLAAVAEMGGGIPDPGPVPAAPAAPDPPARVAELLRPLAPQLQPVCETVGTTAVALALAFSTWPQAMSATTLGVIYDVLTVCAAIAPPEQSG